MPSERAVWLCADLPNGVSGGSGTLIGARLVLTAAHVVFGDDGAPLPGLRVGLPDTPLLAARVVWPATYQPFHDDLSRDVAIAEITDPDWVSPRLGPVRWGRLTGRAPGVECEATGFPRALLDPDGTRDSDQIAATINPGTRRVAGRYDLHVTSSIPKDLVGEPSPWSGASGAGVFAAGLLVAVLVAHEQQYRGRLSAVPVHLLAMDPEFTAIVAEHDAGISGPADLGSVELAGTLLPAAIGHERGRAHGSSPAGLLRADREVVPFHGRADLLEELRAWCEAKTLMDARVLVGSGGQGKTRLGRRLAQQVADNPTEPGVWVTGLLSADAPELGKFADTAGSFLVVIDYAEGRTEQITALMSALWAADRAGRARVLLLARAAGDWWTGLVDTLNLPADRVTELGGLDPVGDPAGGFAAALEALAGQLSEYRSDVDWPTLAPAVPAPPDLASNVAYRMPLTLQLAALTGLLEAVDPIGAAGEPVEATLLRHERRHWSTIATAKGLQLGGAVLAQCVTAATLLGAAGHSEARVVMAAIPALAGQTADTLIRVDTWLRDLYPPPVGRRWGVLVPDRVGEHHVAATLTEDPDLLTALLATASPGQLERAFAVVGRALYNPALTKDTIAGVTDQLGHILHGHLDRYGPVAVRVVTQTARPDRDLLLKALDSATEDAGHDTLKVLVDALPKSSLALSEHAARWAARLVQLARDRHDEDPEDSARTADLAKALVSQSRRLAEHLGDTRREALNPANEAVDLYLGLADTHSGVFNFELAKSLESQARILVALGLSEAVAAITKAVELYRGLAASDPEKFTRDLAQSLNNQASTLGRLGPPAEALAAITEAITLFEGLALGRSAEQAPDLALALNHQALILRDAGRSEEALTAITKAVILYEELATTRPDAFEPDLAMALINQATDLKEAGRSEEGLAVAAEAITLYRKLADTHPERFLPYLAEARTVQALILRDDVNLRKP